jgi:hypothetical protein
LAVDTLQAVKPDVLVHGGVRSIDSEFRKALGFWTFGDLGVPEVKKLV